MNARDARWRDQPGRGHSLPLTGADEYEAETFFPMLGMAIRVVNPGEPTDTYHWETEQEDFLVLSGEALLIVEAGTPTEAVGLRALPTETRHAFVGAGWALPAAVREFATVPEGRPVGLLPRR